jgi:ribokinase|tara:strand:- start:8320 stop:9183 length:864 start_codon:yes stop_codon:yes gene_type:complete
MKILNFGSINKDFVYLVDDFVQPGETISSNRHDIFLGGKGLNQSVALAHAGVSIYHAGCIDKKDSSIINELNNWSVNTENILGLEKPTGHAIIQVNKKGENSIIIHGGTNHSITSHQIDSCLKKFGIGDILVLQNEINNIEEIIDKAYKKGMKIFFNPAPFSKKILNYPLNKVHTIIFNQSEGNGLSMGVNTPKKILEIISKKYPSSNLLITLGEKGSIFKNKKNIIRTDAVQVKTIDTTAAGDTYIGYYIASFSKNQSIRNCMKIASLAASITVTKIGGAISIPKL